MSTRIIAILLTALVMLLSQPASIFCADTWQIDTPVLIDLYAVWGTSDKDLYVGGADNTLLYFDGESWTQVSQISSSTPIIDIMSVWGIPFVPVIAAGGDGTLFMNDGLRWLKFSNRNLTDNDINAVWGSSATNIIAVGSYGTILTSNGTSWNLLTPSITTLDLFCVWGSSADNVYVGGEIGKLWRL